MNNTNITTDDRYLKPKEWQFALAIYEDCVSNGYSPAQILKELSAALCNKFSFSPSQSSAIAEALVPELNNYLKAQVYRKAYIYVSDYRYLLANTPFSTEANINIKKLIVAFLVYYCTYFHSSGWIRYNRKEIFYLAGLSKLPSSEQELLTRDLHTRYNLDMRVIGSAQPISCFSFPWATKSESEPVDPSAPLSAAIPTGCAIGPLTPDTIAHCASSPEDTLHTIEQLVSSCSCINTDTDNNNRG